MFRAFSRPSSGAQGLQWHPLVLLSYRGDSIAVGRGRADHIQINHQLDATLSPVYYPDVYLRLNMFRASSRPSSGAQQLQ